MTTTETDEQTAVTDDDTPTDSTTTEDDEFDALITDLESDRDSWKGRAEDAEKMLDELRERAESAEKAQAAAELALKEAEAATAGEADDTEPPAEASAADAGEPTDGDAVDGKGGDAVDGKGGNAEAAKWRKKLRDAEKEHETAIAALTAERDGLSDTLTRTRQSQIDARLAETGLEMRVLTAGGHTVDSLLGDDGLIDNDRLTAAVNESLAAFNRPRRPSPNPLVGRGGSGGVVQKSGAQVWREAFGA
jgi:hypothetical protein